MKFPCVTPCKNCPYLKSAPLALWSELEFIELINNDKNEMFGKVYGCHKKDDTVCRGWLMNQDSRGLPSIQLRMMLLKNNITVEYFNVIESKMKARSLKLFNSIQEMVIANFPRLKKYI